ncbi:MAG: acetate kinase [Clostridiales bacterium]|nr:acetate kinase [Clostridiales bacterium]
MYILVINAGSSSLKYQLFDMTTHDVMAKGLCERIGIGGRLKHNGKAKFEADIDMPDHAAAIKCVIEKLTSPDYGVISDMKEISAVGHRIVHGGEYFTEAKIVDDEVIDLISECSALAPLHNPGSVTGIKACISVMGPSVPQVVVFDTSFHQTMPMRSYIFPIPYKYYEQYKIRRYGFHGTSHRYVAAKAAEMLGKCAKELNIVTCHLGNGSSICAVKGGKSYDTSMGFTPLDGLPMGTRSGSVDPAIVGFIGTAENISAADIVTMLNKESGLLGISGISSDFRDIYTAANEGNKRAQLAIDILAQSIKKYIGAYAAEMGGIDAVVFTAGIGENNAMLREKVISGLEYMGLGIDSKKNNQHSDAFDISSADAEVKSLVIATNEELMIALDTERLVNS